MANTNRILDFLIQIDPGLATRRLRQVSFKRGDKLTESRSRISEVYFPSSGMISLVVELTSGDRIEAGVIGYQDVLGAGAAFGQSTHLISGMGQIPGEAVALNAHDLAAIAQESAEARNLLHAQEQFLRVQAQQTAACNARHQIPARLATWLLRVSDAIGTPNFDITQEFVAEMLGVQRASISIVASELQSAGLISYRRGHMQIVNQPALEEKACECHRALKRAHAQLFASTLTPMSARAQGGK